jgi:predicted nucleic acid-binding protein
VIAYPDTSFLCALYRRQENSERAAHYFARMPEPLAVASPLLFEFRQSTRWQAWWHSKDARKGFDRRTAQAALAKLEANMATGDVVVVPVDWPNVVSFAERLSTQYTWSEGHRALDLIHVATALHLGVREFLTFDLRQQDLARAEGLRVPLA